MKEEKLNCIQAEISECRKEVKGLKEDMDKFVEKKKLLEKRLAVLSKEMKELKKMVENAIIIELIKVDEEFEFQNGLVDLKRNVLMRVIQIIESEKEIRNIIGIGESFYELMKQPMFRWTRSHKEFPILFGPQPCLAGVTYSGMKVEFTANEYRTVSIDCELSFREKRKYSLVVTVLGGVSVGLARKTSFPSLYAQGFLEVNCLVNAYYIRNKNHFVNDLGNWDGSIPTVVRLVLHHGTLYFYANGKLLPHCVRPVPPDVRFVICNHSTLPSWVEVQSLQSFPVPPPPAAVSASTSASASASAPASASASVSASAVGSAVSDIVCVGHKWRN